MDRPKSYGSSYYAKAKQRLLNAVGRRTTLTRNPRVDFISKRVEEIKTKKTEVGTLASSAKSQLKAVRKTMVDLDKAMMSAYKEELGERKWNDELSVYERVLHPEEKRLVADMERVMEKCSKTMDRVLDSYIEHLEETARSPLTFNTPDEEDRLKRVMDTKEEYKMVRTVYSDAMIDADADLASGADLSEAKKEKVAETKEKYDNMSESLCDDALRYEQIYREELAQRVAGHFTAEQQLLRGVSTAMKDLYPYTRGLTLDWEDMRATRKSNLGRKDPFDDDAMDTGTKDSLPRAANAASGDSGASGAKGSNPFGNISATASGVGAAAANAAKITSKNVSDIIAAYAPSKNKMAATGAKASANSALDKIKL